MMESRDWKSTIRVLTGSGKKIENTSKINKIINIINEAIKQDKEFLEEEGLIGDLKDFTDDLYVRIFDYGSKFEVDLGPKSGEGHDFNFIVKKRTKKLVKDSLAIGSVISEPDD